MVFNKKNQGSLKGSSGSRLFVIKRVDIKLFSPSHTQWGKIISELLPIKRTLGPLSNKIQKHLVQDRDKTEKLLSMFTFYFLQNQKKHFFGKNWPKH